MRVNKAEFYFFLLVVLIGLSGFFSWTVLSLVEQNGAALPELLASDLRRYGFMAVIFAALSVVCSMFLVYPVVWQGLKEQGKLRRITASLSARSRTLEQEAVTDPLTGLYNRRYFDDALGEYLQAFRKIDKPVGMIVLDIDHFKAVNDTHGHDVGDDVLRALGNCLFEFTRYHDVVARMGGEEFAVLSPNVTQAQLHSLAERIRNAVNALTVSAGLAIWDGQESGLDLYRRADAQLYQAKRNGRNRVCA
jgi:two-component system, cell cycle response regulator